MTATKEQCKWEQMGSRLAAMINKAADGSKAAIAPVAAEMPVRMEVAAIGFYSSVLNVITGRLRHGISGFIRSEGDTTIVGLRDPVVYAAYLEWGTRHIKARAFLRTPVKQQARVFAKLVRDAVKWYG